MQHFQGIQSTKDEFIGVPNQFFSDILPIIDDLAELKVTLYCFWAFQRQEGVYRYVRLQEALNDEVLCAAINGIPEIQNAFQRAVQRGTLLAFELSLQGQVDVLYFFNSPRGREALQALKEGHWSPDPLKRSIQIIAQRPNIYTLYEQNIGHITPMIADKLRDAELEFSSEWIAEAIAIAVENNARKWSYIQSILDNWKINGRKKQWHDSSQRSNSQFGTKKGDFSDFFNT